MEGYTWHCNKTRLLLKLGANPNGKSDNAWGYVPLHCAVFSGSTLAYEELRQAGANPWIREYQGYRPGQTPIALAYHILASNMPLDDYFWEIARKKEHSLAHYFPDRYFTPASYSKPGTLTDVQKMIDFEVEKATDHIQAAQPVHVDRPLLNLSQATTLPVIQTSMVQILWRITKAFTLVRIPIPKACKICSKAIQQQP